MTNPKSFTTANETELTTVNTNENRNRSEKTNLDNHSPDTDQISIRALANMHTLGRNVALSPADHEQSIVLACLTLTVPGVAILTDGLFGLTRTKSSTCQITGLQFASAKSRKLALAAIQSAVKYGKFSETPEILQKPAASTQSRNATRTHRAEVNRIRNAERNELKAMILEAYQNGDLGTPRTAKAIATRDKLLAKIPAELPLLTAGRELYRMLSIWGFISHTQYGPAPLYAQTNGSDKVLPTQLMKFIAAG